MRKPLKCLLLGHDLRFPADQALPELEDMENTDADSAAVARYAQEVTNYLGGPDFVVNDKVSP